MILKSTIELTEKELKEIILEYLKNKDTKNLSYHSVFFKVDGGGSYPGDYDPPRLLGAEVSVSLEV